MMSLVIMARIRTSRWRQGMRITEPKEYECTEDEAHLAIEGYLSRGYHLPFKMSRKAAILHKHYPDGTHSQIYVEF